MSNDFRAFIGLGDYIAHSAKGTTWKNHKYIKKENGRYFYNVENVTNRVKEIASQVPKYIEELRARKITGTPYGDITYDHTGFSEKFGTTYYYTDKEGNTIRLSPEDVKRYMDNEPSLGERMKEGVDNIKGLAENKIKELTSYKPPKTITSSDGSSTLTYLGSSTTSEDGTVYYQFKSSNLPGVPILLTEEAIKEAQRNSKKK